jgi:hypothetical protein
MQSIVDPLTLPFLLFCFAVYIVPMAWLTFAREKRPSRLETMLQEKPRPRRRR